jgi:hypothetical protein
MLKKMAAIAPKILSEPEVISASTRMIFSAAIFSIVASFVLQVKGHTEKSLWVGQWATTFLLLGIYDRVYKMMKLFKRFS